MKSPDGSWTARAEIKQRGGPGNAGLETNVSLFRTNDPKPFDVLTLDDKSLQTAEVQIRWQDNKTLEIGHFAESDVVFQVVKAGGVTISVH